MKMYYDKRNNHIYCNDAYSCKESLKALGFRWNSMQKVWFIDCPKDMTVLGNLICDVFVDCKMDYCDFCDFLAVIDREVGQIDMDDAHIAKYQASEI